MKDIGINYIRYFVSLIECGKFSAAAEQLHLSQPALSKSIMTLENQLGAELLKRYRHSFELTDIGRYFYESAVYFLEIYDDFLNNIEARTRSPYSGTVRISASGVLLDMFFPNIILQLSKDYPSIRIFTREENTTNSIQAVLSHKADIGIGLHPLPRNYQNSFVCHHLLSSTFHIVLPKEHNLAKLENIHVKDLEGTNILTPGQYSFIHQEFSLLCEAHHFRPNIVCSCSQIQFLLNMASSGSGCVVLPEVMLVNIPGKLTHRPLIPNTAWELALYHLKNAYLPLPVNVVIDSILHEFEKIICNNPPSDPFSDEVKGNRQS